MYIEISGTKIFFSFWFSLSLCVIMILDTNGLASRAFLSALAHEAGHIAAYKFQGKIPEEIHFTPFGLRLVSKNYSNLSYINEIQAAISGPLVNLLLLILFCILHMKTEALINGALFLFNMMPVSELDGGRALKSALSLLINPDFAEKAVSVFGIAFIFALLLIVVAGANIGRYNLTLLLTTGYLTFLVLSHTGLFNRKRN